MSKSKPKCPTCKKNAPAVGDSLCDECRTKFDNDVVESLSALKVFVHDLDDPQYLIGVMKGLTFLRAAMESPAGKGVWLRNLSSLGKESQALSVKLVKLIYDKKKNPTCEHRFVVLSAFLMLLGAEIQSFPIESLDELVNANGKKFDDYYDKLDGEKRRKDEDVNKSYL